MKITIDEKALEKVNLNLSEALMILLVKTGISIEDLIKEMLKKQMLVEKHSLLGSKLMVTQRWSELCDRALLSVDKEVPDDTRIESLARKLMDVFPQGRKSNTCQYWRGNIRDVTLRLAKFFKMYGNKFTDEQIIEAAKNYVSSFNGNYQYMRILKYFIWKDEKKVNADGEGFINEVSDLAGFIENAAQENILREDWISTLK